MSSTKAQIQLTKTEVSAEQIPWITESVVYAYPITITAKSNVNFEDETSPSEDDDYQYDANIFVLQLSGTGLDPNQGDMFVKISDVVDLYELPVAAQVTNMNSNDATYSTPYYRVPTITLYCRSLEEADQVWKTVKLEVSRFLKNFNLKYMITDSSVTTSETEIIG